MSSDFKLKIFFSDFFFSHRRNTKIRAELIFGSPRTYVPRLHTKSSHTQKYLNLLYIEIIRKMVNWIIVMSIFIVLVFLLYKFKHTQHKYYGLFIVLLLIFLFATGYNIVKKNNLNLTTTNGVASLVRLYFSWLGGVFSNAKDLTGQIIKMDWSGNSTIK